jgi:RNA polymerase sigma factor (sigma-70 family)
MADDVTAQRKCIRVSPAPEVGFTVSGEKLLAILDPTIQRIALRVASDYRLGNAAFEDILQEVRLRVLRVLRHGRPLSPAYMFAVVKNAVRTALAEERRQLGFPTITIMPLPEDQAEQEKIEALMIGPCESDPLGARNVSRWIGALPRKLQAVHRLIYLEGMTQTEAATALGVSASYISRLHRRLLKLGRIRFAQV